MSMSDTPVFCHLLVDMQSKVERTTESILKQNGWKFLQDGRYTEDFISITQPIFITQDVVTNGLEIYITPNGGTLSVYDYSVFVQKTFIP